MEKTIGLLRLRVIRGVNLAIRDSHSSDPYVIVRMGNMKVRTRVMKKNLNPEWNEELTLSITDPTLPVKIMVYDRDWFSRDDPMGDAVFHIGPFLEAIEMQNKLGRLPNGTVIMKIEASRQNCLSEESKIVWHKGKMIQHMFLKLQNVERGEVELQLEWIDTSGSPRGLRKGTWTAEEDSFLRQCIHKHGEGKWHQVPLRAGLNRCRKSCRLRWLNYLKPSIKRGSFSSDEVDLLLRLHKLLGNRWSLIAGRLPGRTANDVKNYWNTHLRKKHKLCCKKKMTNRNITSNLTTPTPKIDIIKPKPQYLSSNNSCSHLNVLQEVEVVQSCLGQDNNNVCLNSITCNKDEERDKIVKNLMDGDDMWWGRLLEESHQETDMRGPEATARGKEVVNFEVAQLWSLFDEETVKLN